MPRAAPTPKDPPMGDDLQSDTELILYSYITVFNLFRLSDILITRSESFENEELKEAQPL